MRLTLTLLLSLASTALFGTNPETAVLWSQAPSYRSTTAYSYTGLGTPRKDDSIYVYFRGQKGNLHAGTPLPAVFQWDSLQLVGEQLTYIPFKTESNVLLSSCAGLRSGYYRVRIQSTESQDTLGAWICQDTFQFSHIEVLNNSCENLQLKPITRPSADGYSRYFYYDLGLFPTPFKTYFPRGNVPYILRAAWSADAVIRPNVSGANEGWTTQVSPFISGPAPLVGATYTACLTNIFGDTLQRSTGAIPAKATLARFLISSDQELIPQADTLRGEAPLSLSFNGSPSGNAESFNWKGFKNMSSRRIGALLPEVDWEESGFNTVRREDALAYTLTDKFPIQLRVSNSHGCADSLIRWVRVDSSLFDSELVPNLFSPNGDGNNDFFKLKADRNNKLRSIRTLEITLFNRNGESVFSSSKIDFSWDGKASGTNYACPPGVYFWVIKATGYDKKRYKGKEYRGLVHLFR